MKRHLLGMVLAALLPILGFLAPVAVSLAPTPAAAQSGCQYMTYGTTLTPAMWQSCWASKQNYATGQVIGPSSATTGNVACWGTFPALTDCGALPSVLAGTNITVTKSGNAYTVNSSAGATFANPTASIGLSAINGSATTAMRSDAAPALSQSITPTWTGLHTFSVSPVIPIAGLGDNSTKAASTAYVQTVFARNYIAGLTLSTAGGSGAFAVAAGEAADSGNAVFMQNAASLAKNTNSWVVGAAQGCLDTGSIANGWYHIYMMRRPDTGVVDVSCSVSASAPTTGGNIPAAYTQFRDIGAIKITSATWDAFTQIGDDFFWTTPVTNTGTLASATPSLVTLAGAPTGTKVKLHLSVNITVASGGSNYITVSSPDTGGQAASINNAIATVTGATGAESGQTDVWSNTSGQAYVAVTGAVSATWTAGVMGWTNPRGKNN